MTLCNPHFNNCCQLCWKEYVHQPYNHNHCKLFIQSIHTPSMFNVFQCCSLTCKLKCTQYPVMNQELIIYYKCYLK